MQKPQPLFLLGLHYYANKNRLSLHRRYLKGYVYLLISPKQIPCVHLLLHVSQGFLVEAVGDDDVALGFEGGQVVYDFGAEELGAVLKGGLVDDDGDALGLDALHYALDGRGAEVVAVGLDHSFYKGLRHVAGKLDVKTFRKPIILMCS